MEYKSKLQQEMDSTAMLIDAISSKRSFTLADAHENGLKALNRGLTDDISFHLKYFTPNQFDALISKQRHQDWELPYHIDTFELNGLTYLDGIGTVEFSSIDGFKNIPMHIDNIGVENKIRLLKGIEEVL